MRGAEAWTNVAALSAGAAALWPNLVCAWSSLSRSPLERALDASWCSAGAHAQDMLGHCPACWIGVALAVALTHLSTRGMRINGISAKAIRVAK